MEFLLIFGIHFFIMGSAVMLLSVIVSFVAKKIPFFVTVLGCMLLGVLYANAIGFSQMLWFAALFNGVFSAIAVGLVKFGEYAGKRAEKIDG
ncbi:hypothetical protein FZC76_14760 [Sutcliffiella horikoshii]|uniref:Uncharacterized protein n=1 Tax=Sutcliffiella horikoshii TaxID=79883 RepID=A0A5D4SWK8_9BACI|nr:hypothetical protein [Sutcliffiella horikoshii]TYS67817.1 hypothetical protein FZC76_14760 [Sutcliffiella horikoshii]